MNCVKLHLVGNISKVMSRSLLIVQWAYTSLEIKEHGPLCVVILKSTRLRKNMLVNTTFVPIIFYFDKYQESYASYSRKNACKYSCKLIVTITRCKLI